MAAEDDFLHPRSLAIGLGAGVGDAGAFDQGGFGDVNLAPPASGLGLAGARDDQDMKYLQSLPTAQKIGLALQAFSAGVAGRPSPIDAVLERARAQRTERRHDLQRTIETISKGMEVMRKLPMGTTERDAMGKVLSDAVGGGEIGQVFQVAGQQGEEVQRVLRTFEHSDEREKLLNACASALDFNACILQQGRDKDFMARIYREVDAKRMPAILAIFSKIQERINEGALKEYAAEDGKLNISRAKLIELNTKLGLFADAQMDTIWRNEGMLIDYGIRTEKSLQVRQEKREKGAEDPDKDPKQPQTISVAGTVYQFDPEKKNPGKRLATDSRYVALGAAKSPKEERGLTAYQEARLEDRDEETLTARGQLKRMGVNWKTGEGKEKYTKPQIPIREGSKVLRDNPDYDPTIRGLLSKSARGLSVLEDPEHPKKPTAAQVPAAPAAKATGKAPLTEAQRKQVLDAVNAALQKGADPKAVKKWAKDKHGLDLILK